MPNGTLYMVATPIGNLADISLRALDTLRSVSLIAAEDTRRTRKLLSHYDIHKPLISYHEHNAGERGPELIGRLREGEDVALVTDAGTPGISDPGTALVLDALEAGIAVTAIPGPSAAITALIVSGLSTHPFAFLGFPPSRGAGRRQFFAKYAALPMTLILYESPQRIRHTLEDIAHYWGERRVAAARELTKLHEEVFRGSVSEALEYFSEGGRGEFTLVVEGSAEDVAGAAGVAVGRERGEESTAVDWREDLERMLSDSSLSVKDVAEKIAVRYRIPRRTAYREALNLKKGGGGS